MACGEGYGTGVLARRAARVTGVDANPEAHAHAAAKYTAPGVRFERDLIDHYTEPCDAVVFLQTIEHVQDPAAVLRHFKAMAGVAFVSTPNLLTLAPEGAEKSDNPWHVKEYRARGVPRAVRVGVRPGRGLRPVPRPQAAPARAGAVRGLGRRARQAAA